MKADEKQEMFDRLHAAVKDMIANEIKHGIRVHNTYINKVEADATDEDIEFMVEKTIEAGWANHLWPHLYGEFEEFSDDKED